MDSVPSVAPGASPPECGSHGAAGPEISSSSKRGRGGPRPNSGGPRANSGGARPNSGGPRINSGGSREGAGRRAKPAVEPAAVLVQGPHWYCLVTPPGHELWAIMEAVTAEVAVLLPLHQPEKGAAWAPVYPGFVFVRFDRLDFAWRVLVDADRGWRLLGPDQEHPAVVPDAEIERMRQLYGPEGSNGEWKPPPPRPLLAVGSRVTVEDGPLTSFPGTVIEDRGERVRVAVEIFGRITDCDLPRAAVEPA